MAVPRSSVALAVALAGSLAGNVLLWKRAPAPAPAPPLPSAVAPAPAPPVAPSLDAEACAAELQKWRSASWSLVLQSLGHGHGASVPADPPPAGSAEPPPEDGDTVDGARLLCERAQDALRDTWLRDKDLILGTVAYAFSDPDEQARNQRQVLDAMVESAHLNGAQARKLEGAYVARRNAVVSASLAALRATPPDTRALFEQMRGMYTAEDDLLADIGGPESRAAWRAHERENRTVLLAVFATLADAPWDSATRW